MRIVEKRNPISNFFSYLKSFGRLNIFFFVVFIAFAIAIMAQFANPTVLQNLLSDAAYDPSTRTFTEKFDSSPSSPQQFTQMGQETWDIQIHGRDDIYRLPSMDAMHGSDCSAPPASHQTTGAYEDSVFICRNHLMTAIDAGGYGVVYFTPNAMADFSNGETVVTFEMSTEKMSSRDWWDITISPFNDTQALPLLSDLSQGVDLQNPNKNSLVITTDNGEGSPNLKVVRDGQITAYPNNFFNFTQGIQAGTNQMATRQPFKLTISKTRVKFERLASSTATALTIIDQTIPELSWSQGVVQFGHHGYTPTKDGAGVPGTWHWDTIGITPATPFTMIKANRRYADQQNPSISFQKPAPENSYLRFSGQCSINVDGIRAQKMTNSGHPEHMSSYMVPIAQGKQNFTFTFGQDEWFFQNCIAKDFAIWSLSPAVGGNNPQPTIIEDVFPTIEPTQSIPTPIACPTAPPCEGGVLAVGDPAPGSENQCPQYFCTFIPTNTPVPPTATPTVTLSKNAIITLQPRTKQVTSGQTLSVDVMIDTAGKSINAAEATITFPSNLLTSPTASLDKTVFGIETGQSVTSGSITVSGASTTPRSGIVRLATLTFRTASQGTATLAFSGVEIIESGSNQNVFGSAQNGTYTITVAPTATPTRTPPTPTPTPGQKSADLNRDGKVNIQDLSLLLTYRKNRDLRGDLNNDGTVNMTDVSILVKNWS